MLRAGLLAAAGGATTWLALDAGSLDRESREHLIHVEARSYAFDPAVIQVERGDRLRLRFASLDVVHGFRLEGYDLDVTIAPLTREVAARRGVAPPELTEEVVLVADRAGKFRYRCSRTCGSMHPFMQGELLVSPNRLHQVATAGAVGLLFGSLGLAWIREPDPRTP